MRLIDADEAYKVLTDYYHQRAEIQHKALKEAFERVPTVDAEPVRRGKWKRERNPMMYQIVPYVFVCDQCGTAFEYDTPYCGECGAKMDEVEDG